MTSLTLNLKPAIELTDEQFFQLCQANQDLRFERTATGELIIMPPTGGETGNRNAGIIAQLWLWNNQNQLGLVFDSSTGFKLPNGADRLPDASWLKLERWNSLTQEQKEKFIPLCPDFVIELLSPSDNLRMLQEKMKEYLDNGTHLGWLINRKAQQVEIYRSNQEVEVIQSPATLLGENVLTGFVLDLEKIW
ncbi:Uma2 family endonuclease [Gloeocapsopsis crepidinum LEGE 06123]|uniref:Uma2 family endonuclease n=1 Tax=Gloeocapsopsis crepidinum LEGE 06123 TaxID=588587 RepID=A0ABR9UX39_9CHRO|nr:Uma2 family endonuclease [Gloeocapsopsis crepidinum]MBE9192851.1 Uma2 family endonuclease [Gloeocapsopsis crepidinum LEGE 06123]